MGVIWCVLLTLQLFTVKNVAENVRPIIGVLAQESDGEVKRRELGDTYIQEPYVSFLEQAGARVVPIQIDKDDDYYTFLFERINGMLMPGGGSSIINSGYASAARIMYDLAVKATDDGDPFPIWGTCLGFEQLTNLTADEDLMVRCEGTNYSLPLDFVTDARKSRLFKDIDPDLLEAVQKYRLTYNHHKYCMTKQLFENHKKLNEFYRMITVNEDLSGLTFVSTMEAYDYPFYGAQWHAEKNSFFWQTDELINHSLAAVRLAQYMANFFVQETRQSKHHFEDADEESEYMIRSDNPVYMGPPYFYSVYIYNFTMNDTTVFYGLDLTACAGRLQLALILLVVIFMAASAGVLLRQHCLRRQPGVIVLADSKLLKKVRLGGWTQQDGNKNFKMHQDDKRLMSNMDLHTIDMGII